MNDKVQIGDIVSFRDEHIESYGYFNKKYNTICEVVRIVSPRSVEVKCISSKVAILGKSLTVMKSKLVKQNKNIITFVKGKLEE